MTRHHYYVEWVDTIYPEPCHHAHTLEASSPEQAGGEALLRSYGAVRPAGAPERVTVDGLVYAVDEWVEASVYLVPNWAPPERAQVERCLRHVRLARASLQPFAGRYGSLAERRARGVHAELGELEARTEALLAELPRFGGSS